MTLMLNMNKLSSTKEKGFTLLYSLIISSLILATVLSIVNVALKQSNIAGLGKQSQVAFYAANSGMECALYWTLHGRTVSTNVGDITIPLFKIPRDDNDDFLVDQYDSPLNDDFNLSIRTDDDSTLPTINCFDESLIEESDIYDFNTQYSFTSNQWHEAVKGDEVDTELGADLDQLCGQGFLDSEPSLDPEDYRVWLFRVIMQQDGSIDQTDPCAEVAVCRRLDSASLSISSRGYNTCDISSDDVVERAVRLIQL